MNVFSCVVMRWHTKALCTVFDMIGQCSVSRVRATLASSENQFKHQRWSSDWIRLYSHSASRYLRVEPTTMALDNADLEIRTDTGSVLRRYCSNLSPKSHEVYPNAE
jgi:hypothetical protein